MEKTKLGSCSYHLCEKKNVTLHKCKYCDKYYCEEHLNAKAPMLAPFKSTNIEDHLKWREKGHPCPEYAVRPREKTHIIITKKPKKLNPKLISEIPKKEPEPQKIIKKLPKEPKPLITMPEPISKPQPPPEPKEYCSIQVKNRFGDTVKKAKIELILLDENYYDNPVTISCFTNEKGRVYPNESPNFKEGKYVINATTDKLLSANENVDVKLGKETSVSLLFENITKDGKKIIARKNKKTKVEIEKILKDSGIEKKNPERIKVSGSKKPSNPYVNKLKSWFFWKKYPHSGIYKTDLMVQIAVVSCLLFLFMFIYSSSDSLNEINLSIIKLGSTVALILILLLLWYVYKLLKNLRYGFKGLANGFKLITALICVILCFQLYTAPSFIINPVTDFDYGALNPFDIDWNSSSFNSPYDKGEDSIPSDDNFPYEEENNYINPTYQEMYNFIIEDTIDLNEYTANYVCDNFARDVIANARNKGYKAGYVRLYEPGGFGHAIVCFETTDKGLYCLEPQLDEIFPILQLDDMVNRGIYDIEVSYGDYYYEFTEYFYMSLSGYDIDWDI